jgi:cytoskeletal protein CcmA (bactofilin family)
LQLQNEKGDNPVFGNKTQAEVRRTTTPSKDHGVTILTSGCSFSGKLYCRGASRIGGKIEGEIVSENSLVIEEGAEIFANIQAEEAVIQGYVKGRIRASKRVELCANARFDGDIASPSLIVREGAQFNGTSEMTAPIEQLDSKGKRTPVLVKDSGKRPEASKELNKGPHVDTIAVRGPVAKSEPEVSVAQ